MSERPCPFCGFLLGREFPANSDTGRCPGCGKQVAPHPDHDPPWPGILILPDEGERPFVPGDDAPPEAKGVVALLELDYEYGRGVGMEPYGYHTLTRQQVIDIGEYVHAPAHRHERYVVDAHQNRVYDCPTCDSPLAEYTYSADRANVAGGIHVECLTCGETLFSEMWD